MVVCKCDCGKVGCYQLSSLKNGHTKSCGCVRRKWKNKLGTNDYVEIYKTWNNIIQRCANVNKAYYFGKGISVCDDWKKDFLIFYEWCINNGYSKGLQIDRQDNSKGYSPENCRLVTRVQNMRNTSRNRMIEYCGIKKPLIEWAQLMNVNPKTFRHRIVNWGIEKTFNLNSNQLNELTR